MALHLFPERNVKRVLDKNNKVYVIISDAMRFEIGEELSRRIRAEDKFDASLDDGDLRRCLLIGNCRKGQNSEVGSQGRCIGGSGGRDPRQKQGGSTVVGPRS